MPKKEFTGAPGSSEVCDVVTAWARRQGIDPAMITGYSIFQHLGEVPRIMLEMYFDDTPVKSEDVSRETSEHEPSIVTVLRADHLAGQHYGPVPNSVCPLCKPPIPDWCPDVLLCFNCPGRLSGEQVKCDHWPQVKDESKEG